MIEQAVVTWIADRGSQGYPHFIQEYAHAAFDADTDNSIDMADLTRGVYRENGALAQLGKKYFESMYLIKLALMIIAKFLEQCRSIWTSMCLSRN